MLSVVGLPFYYLASQGNSIYYSERPLASNIWIVFSMTIVTIYVTVPFFHRADFGLFHSGPSEDAVQAGQEIENNRAFLGPVSFGLGLLLVVVLSLQWMPESLGRFYSVFGTKAVSRNLRSALETKAAAIHKMDRLLENAIQCHLLKENNHQQNSIKSSNTTNTEPENPMRLQNNLRSLAGTMDKYHQSVVQMEKAGGILWTWRKIRDRSLFYEEGIWLWQRLVATNMAQWFTMLIWIALVVFAQIYFGGRPDVDEEFINNQFISVVTVGFPLAFFTS
jgi:hypothetical protein